MKNIVSFYKDVICQRAYIIPLLFFSIISFGFSVFNRTVSIDDILRHYAINNSIRGRWGGYLYANILGITEFDPFIDRFLAVLFFIVAATLLSYLFYLLSDIRNVWAYTISSSVFISYPLVNEIWEYTTANSATGCYLSMVTLAVILLRKQNPNIKIIMISSLLILIPMSGYEISIFYYISLVCLILFYENYKVGSSFKFSKWIKQNICYFLPVVIAFILRYVISLILLNIYDLEYSGCGDTHITWLTYDFIPTFKGMLVSNFIHYILFGFVYFPITLFVAALLFFIQYVLRSGNLLKNSVLGFLLVASLFLQAFIQGDLLPYRHTVTVTLFVTFVVFLLCSTVEKGGIKRLSVYVVLFGICWYQAVFLNRILGLNNLRSDNE